MKTRTSPEINVLAATAAGILVVSNGLPAVIPGDPTLEILGRAIGLVGAALVAFLGKLANEATVRQDDTVEALAPDGQTVVAGPANDLVPAGEVVRELGEDPKPRHAVEGVA